jgi:hypothetical protein
MDFSVVLNHLQSQFSGQLVLYPKDIAKVLGKSEKAIAHLIARSQLPFKVKMLGGHRCVGIYEVAQWLASDQEVAQEVTAPPTIKPSRAAKAVVAVKGPKMLKRPEVASAPERPAKKGLMVDKILAMRHDAPQVMARFANSLRDVNAVVFMHEVLEELFYPQDMLTANYVVTVKRFASKASQAILKESRAYFLNEENARNFTLERLSEFEESKSLRTSHLLLEHGGTTKFHVVVSNGQVLVLNNAIDFYKPGR